MPKLPTAGQFTRQLQDGVWASLTLMGTFIASAWLGRQAQRWMPAAVPAFLTKLAVAAGTVSVAGMVVRDPKLRSVSLAGAFFPLVLEGVSMVTPGLAAQVPIVGAAALPAPQPASGTVGMAPGNRLSDFALGAELEAELEQDSEMGVY